MAYIGNTVQNQGFAPAVDYFNGDGTTVTFTLSRPIASVAQLIVSIENVIQNPSSAFTVSGNSITFTSAPPSGTNNIWVEYTSLITTYAAISQDPSVVGDITASGGYSSTGDYGNSFVDGVIMDYVTGNARITTGASDGITLYNGGTSARSALMTITSAGNVGIGTTSPSTKLQVNDAITIGTADKAIQWLNSGTALADIRADSSNNLIFRNTSSYTERMRIDSSGNVGIGTASPAAKLDVGVSNGYLRSGVNGSDTNYNIRANSGSNCSITWTENGQADRWTVGCVASQGYLAFKYNSSNMGNGTEAMRLDSSGNLLVGTTTAYGHLSVYGITGSDGTCISLREWGSGAGSAMNLTARSTANADVIYFNTSSTNVGKIAITSTATSYVTSSDYRLKENIAPMTGALATVSALKPVTYTWKADGSDGQGFIAHELQAVVPDCVTGEKDAVDADGKPVYQGIDTSFLVATLTAAIQEQQAIITDLKARIETLENK